MEVWMNKFLATIWKELVILWEDSLIFLRCVLYTVVIIFLMIGAAATFTGAPAPGIFLLVLNVLLLFLMRKLGRAAFADFDKDFQEMVRKNLEEQNPDGGE